MKVLSFSFFKQNRQWYFVFFLLCILTHTNLYAQTISKQQMEIADGYVVVEGDILLSRVVEYYGSNAAVINESKNSRWQNAIPYEIAANHPRIDKIERAIQAFNNVSPICIVPRNDEHDYVEFVTGSICASFVGRREGGQVIIISNNCSHGNILHEICHAAGLYHEHCRQDRDDFIQINWDNVLSDKRRNFEKYKTDSGTDIGPYDFGSIMHYPPSAFAIDRNIPTIRSRNGEHFGQRSNLSFGDIAGLQYMYPNTRGCLPQPNTLRFKVTAKKIVWTDVNDTRSYEKEYSCKTIAILQTHKGEIKAISYDKFNTLPSGCYLWANNKCYLKKEHSHNINERLNYTVEKSDINSAIITLKSHIEEIDDGCFWSKNNNNLVTKENRIFLSTLSVGRPINMIQHFKYDGSKVQLYIEVERVQ